MGSKVTNYQNKTNMTKIEGDKFLEIKRSFLSINHQNIFIIGAIHPFPTLKWVTRPTIYGLHGPQPAFHKGPLYVGFHTIMS